jgi:Spy/CpxP family protein refolding chaperone
MKRAWLIALVATVMSVSSIYGESKAATAKPAANQAAGDDEDHDRGIDRRLEAMTTELKLSKSQQEEVRKLLEASRDQQKEMRKQMNQKRKALREETDQKIAATLKADQKTKFEAMRAERGGRAEKDAQNK